MGRTPKNETCDKVRCKQHHYILKPLKKNLYFSKAEKVKFCPKYNKQNKKFECIFPIVNKDAKSYTPFFILEDQKRFYEENDVKFKANHQKRIIECASKQEIPLLFVFNQYFRWFLGTQEKDNFVQYYLDHIGTEEHKEQLRKNKYTEYILDIAKLFQKEKKYEIQSPPDQLSQDIYKYLSNQFTKSS